MRVRTTAEKSVLIQYTVSAVSLVLFKHMQSVMGSAVACGCVRIGLSTRRHQSDRSHRKDTCSRSSTHIAR